MDSRGATRDRDASSAAGCACRVTTRASCARGSGSPAARPSRSGKDPIAHILWLQDARARHRARDVEVPRAEGLAELQAHGRRGGDVRLDRPALGHRQPRSRTRRLRRRSARGWRASTARSCPTSCPRPTVLGAAAARRRGRPRARRRASPSSAARPTCSRPRSVRARSATSRATSTSARRRGSRATCRSRRPTSCTASRRCRRRCRASTTSPTSRRSAGACLNWLRDNVLLPDDALRETPVPADVYRAHRRARRERARGQQRRHLHAVAERRAHAGRRSPAARRVAQPVAARRPAPIWCARCSKGVAYNSRWLLGVGREVHRPAVPVAELHRRRRAVGPVVPDPWPTCSTARSGRSSTRCTPTPAARRCSPP